MKRKLVAVTLTTCMMLAGITACGQESTEDVAVNNTETKEAAAEEESVAEDAVSNLIAATDGTVELTVWAEGQDQYLNVVNEIVENFKEEYSDVSFDINVGANSAATAKDDVLQDVENAADVFMCGSDQIPGLVKGGALQSIDATFTYDPTTEDSEASVAAATVDGTMYAYPLTASSGYFLFYDSNYLTEEDVSSFDNLLAAAERQGKTVGMEVSGAWYLYGFFAGAGLDMYSNEDGSNTCNWNATDTKYKGVDVAASIADICKSSAMVDCRNEDAQAFALKGEMIADVNGVWATSAFKEAYGDGYAATKLPTFTVNGDQVQMGSFSGYRMVGVNAYSKNTGWAMLLAEYLTNEENQAKIAVATEEAPTNLKAAESETLNDSPALRALSEQSEYADDTQAGDNFWAPGATLGKALVEGNYSDLQQLLDTAVEGITQPVTE